MTPEPEPPAPASATTSPATAGNARKFRLGPWTIAAAVVVLFLAYPVAHRLMGGGTPSAEGTAALAASFQAFTSGRYQDSIVLARAAMAADPNLSADAYNNIAVANWKLGQLDEGIKAAQQALRLKPDYDLARNNLAAMQREQAGSNGRPAPGALPDAATALLNQSVQHAQAKQFKECIDTATQSVKLDPSSARAFNNIAFCAANLQRWDEAIKNAQEAIRLAPDLQIARNNLAWAQQEKAKTGRTPQ